MPLDTSWDVKEEKEIGQPLPGVEAKAGCSQLLRVLDMEAREGNGTLLQYSCLENPMDGGAWWAAVNGDAQSRTQLKRLSSSSSSRHGGRVRERFICLNFSDPRY